MGELVERLVRVTIRVGSDKYTVECCPPLTRCYFTDKDLPDEIKYKLGMVMFGYQDERIGEPTLETLLRAYPASDPTYFLYISYELYSRLSGVAHDT